MIKNSIIETSVAVKESKIPNHWSSAVPKKYKKNSILGKKKRFDSSNYKIGRPLSTEKKIKKVIRLTKDELGLEIIKEFVRLRAEIYSYLKEKNDEDKKAKSTKKCVIKRELKILNHKSCSEAAQKERKKTL